MVLLLCGLRQLTKATRRSAVAAFREQLRQMGCRLGTSRGLQADNPVICLRRRILVACPDVLGLKEIVFGKDFPLGGSGGEQIEHVLHTQPETANARATAAFAGFDGDAIQVVLAHSVKSYLMNGFFAR